MAKEGRPLKFETADELEAAIQAYFDNQVESKAPITISGLAYFLGFESRQSIYDYKERQEFSYILKRATFFVESCYEEKLSGTTPTGAIFALKNMGWRDKVETGFTDSNGKDVKPQLIFQPAPNCTPIEEDINEIK
jgi:hypothetical protein